MRVFPLILLVGLGGCAQVQMFAEGDLSNAAALAEQGGDDQGAECWTGMMPAFAASPQPSTDGIAVIEERKRLFVGATAGPCASVILPALLKAIGKLSGPFGAALPF